MVGLAIGPSLGDLYVGNAGRAAVQSALRTAVMGGTVGLVAAICRTGCDLVFGTNHSNMAPAVIVGLIGTVATAALAIRDVKGVPELVREHNARESARAQRRDAGKGVQLSMRPLLSPARHRVGGLLTVRF